MHHLPARRSLKVAEFLREAAPWESERLESIDQLVSSWPDWSAERTGGRQHSYSWWLRTSYRMFRRSAVAESVS